MPTFIAETLLGTSSQAADIQSAYEVGAAIGSVLLGFCTDLVHSRRSPVILASVVIAAAISFCITVNFASWSNQVWYVAMFALGFFIGSVNTFLVMTCPQDLGRAHGRRATSTITGVVDGIGSAGSGIG